MISIKLHDFFAPISELLLFNNKQILVKFVFSVKRDGDGICKLACVDTNVSILTFCSFGSLPCRVSNVGNLIGYWTHPLRGVNFCIEVTVVSPDRFPMAIESALISFLSSLI